MHEQEMHKKMVKNFLLSSCINCINWDNKPEECVKFKQRPPAEVIVLGCAEWEQDIPF